MGSACEQLNPSQVDETVEVRGGSYLVTAKRHSDSGTWSVSVEAVAIDGDPPSTAWDGEIPVGAGFGSPLSALAAGKSWLAAHP